MNILSLNLRGWGDSEKRRQLASLIRTGKFDFICLQETKRESLDNNQIGQLWGNYQFDWSFMPSRGLSGGILSSWLVDSWSVNFSFKGVGFVGVCAVSRGILIYVVNVYAPCSLIEKRKGWEELKRLKMSFARGEWCVVGDFNSVTSVEERRGRSGDGSNFQDIVEFNNFVDDMDLIDVSVSGKKFSWFCSDGISMS